MKPKLVPIKYIDQLTTLPKIPPVLLETEPATLLFHMESSFWVCISLWLENKVGGQALPPEALQEPAMWFEPYADYYADFFRLTAETHPRTDCLDLLKFRTPEDLWLHCIETTAQQGLEEVGLLGTPARLIGKREAYNNTKRVCQ